MKLNKLSKHTKPGKTINPVEFVLHEDNFDVEKFEREFGGTMDEVFFVPVIPPSDGRPPIVVSSEIFDMLPIIGHNGFLVYSFLASITPAKTTSVSQIVEKTGLYRKEVQRAINRLQEEGLIPEFTISEE